MGKIINHELFLKQILDTVNPDIELLGEYTKSTEKILCKCRLCGHEWGMLPGNIKKGRGCPMCKHEKSNRTKNSKSKAKLLSYIEQNCSFKLVGEYIDSTTKVECMCNICNHYWSPLPSNILKGQGCPKCGRKSCSKKLSLSKEDILKSLPSDVELLLYTRAGEPALFKCRKCSHEWFYIPSNLITKKRGCPICSGYLKTNDIFLRLLRDINPDVEVLESYINATTKLLCKCRKCGCLWKSDPHHLLQGKGCPCCNKSKGELIVLTILQNYNIPFTYQYYLKSDFASKIFVDFLVQVNNITYFIEYNGILHYESVDYFGGEEQYKKLLIRDQYLREYCINNNIILIELKYDLKKDDIEEIIKNKIIGK